MSNTNKVIPIAAKHIEPGIEKYKGQLDNRISVLIKNAGFNYVPYTFKDGRVLLVLPNNVGALLYPNEKAVFDTLALEE